MNLKISIQQMIKKLGLEKQKLLKSSVEVVRQDQTWQFLNNAQNLENWVWYLGDEDTLTSFYQDGSFKTLTNMVSINAGKGRGNNFYAVKGKKGRVIHTGIPKNITQAKVALLFDPEWTVEPNKDKSEDEGEAGTEEAFEDFSQEWETIKEKQNIKRVLHDMATYASVFGWGFALPVFNPDQQLVSWRVPNPMDCIVVKENEEVVSVRYVQPVVGAKDRVRYLHTIFTTGMISYAVYEDELAEKTVAPSEELLVLAGKETMTFNGLEAIPALMVEYTNNDYSPNLGYFDSMDETISSRVDESRRGKLMRFIPKQLLEIDPETGKVKKFKNFDLDFMVLEQIPQNIKDMVITSKVDIDQKKYNDSFLADLSFVLPNVGLSPTTLGRYMGGTEGKEINADREGVSIKTRNKMIKSYWQFLVKDMVYKSIILNRFFAAFNGLAGRPIESEDVATGQVTVQLQANLEVPDFTIQFENYLKPTEEEKHTAVRADFQAGLMSRFQALKALHPEMSQDEIEQEEQRIRQDRGEVLVDANPPQASDLNLQAK